MWARPQDTKNEANSRRTSKLHLRADRLHRDLGNPFAEDPRLQSYATALDAADGTATDTQRRPRPAFLKRADHFLAAHEIGLVVISTAVINRVGWDLLSTQAMWLFDVESIRRGHVRTVGALKSLETGFFAE